MNEKKSLLGAFKYCTIDVHFTYVWNMNMMANGGDEQFTTNNHKFV